MTDEQKQMVSILEQTRNLVEKGLIASLAVITALPNDGAVISNVVGVRNRFEANGLIDAGKDAQDRRADWGL